MALADVIDQYVTAFGAMTGITRCYSDPPESIQEFPAAIVYAKSGTINMGGGGLVEELHTIILEIHHERQMLELAVDAAKVWPRRVTTALYNGGTFGGYVTAVVWPIYYDALAVTYGSAQDIHYVMQFRITTKVLATL